MSNKLSNQIEAKLKESEDSPKNPLGYIDKTKPVFGFYLRVILFIGIVILFIVNSVMSFYKIRNIPEPRFFITTTDGQLHEVDIRYVSKGDLESASIVN